MSLFAGLPDILASRNMAEAHNRVKRNLVVAREEVVAGERQDRVAALGGDTGRLMALERAVTEIEARQPLLEVARVRASTTQAALGAAQEGLARIGVQLQDRTINQVSSATREIESKRALEQLVMGLNTNVNGRFVFSGADADGRALAEAETLIDAVLVGLNAGATAADALQAVDDFFDPPATTTYPGPASFDGDIWLGSGDAPPIDLGDGVRVAYALRGNDPAIKEVMKGLALAAAFDRSIHAADPLAREEIMVAAGTTLLNANDALTRLRAQLGTSESHIDAAIVASATERTSLMMLRSDLIGVDQYEAATEVRALETQLEALYAMTSRSLALSLVNYLK